MITPKFECIQNDEFVIVTIQIPHVKMTEMEYSIDNNSIEDEEYVHTKSLFRFYVKPYFLRLHFAQELQDDGNNDFSKYDPDNEKLIVNLPKKNRGEYFENLNMITWLLGSNRETQGSSSLFNNLTTSDNQPIVREKETKGKAPLIEVVESNEDDNIEVDDEAGGMYDDNAGVEDWEQQLPGDKSASEIMKEELGIARVYYGFNRQFTDIFTKFSQEYINEIIDVPLNPEILPAEEKTKIREMDEVEAFDPEHYLLDMLNKERDIKMIFDFKPAWIVNSQSVQWTEKEQKMLSELPKKEYLISNELSVYCGLVDLLCTFTYNHRSFMGENNVESPWTICKMSSQLSWLEELTNMKDTLQIFISRTCCFALYRNFDLALQCIRDMVELLILGKEYVLRALLEVKDILAHTLDKYLLNKIYIDNYCIWIQNVSNQSLQQLAQAIIKIVNEDFLGKRSEFLISNAVSLKKLEDYAQDSLQEAGGNVEDLVMTEQDKERPTTL